MYLSQPNKLITAYHGTSARNASSIIYSSFVIQSSQEDWLGYGAYFFVHGISCPIQNANEWALNTHQGVKTAIIKAEIEIPDSLVLDLRKSEHITKYNIEKNKIITQHKHFLSQRRDISIKKRRDIRVDDQIITNLIADSLEIKIVIHNTYIKNSLQRELSLESSYPNATVCCVRDIKLIKNTALLGAHPSIDAQQETLHTLQKNQKDISMY